ncbi:hypothetical protein [Gynuella sp.]|uniref:hypothetical protein n=1 Tax=Gynuella sp. TaxID=2969146 RepID=UPI003D12C3A6
MSNTSSSSLHQIDINQLQDEDHNHARSVTSRSRVREAVAADVESFLKNGGSVTEVPKGLRADPPKKPGNAYGSRPI